MIESKWGVGAVGEDGWDKGHKTRDRGHGPTHGDPGEGKRRGTQDTGDTQGMYVRTRIETRKMLNRGCTRDAALSGQ